MRMMLKSKIHRATVTYANINYEGSITIDRDLMDAADLLPYELVHVLDVNNGARLETYVIEGPRGSGIVGMNGAAARLIPAGDVIIILAYRVVANERAKNWHPKIVYVDESNRIIGIGDRVVPPILEEVGHAGND